MGAGWGEVCHTRISAGGGWVRVGVGYATHASVPEPRRMMRCGEAQGEMRSRTVGRMVRSGVGGRVQHSVEEVRMVHERSVNETDSGDESGGFGEARPGAEVGGDAVTEVDVPGMVLRVRRLRDLSQRELGAMVGVDQSQIARIEGGRRRVDVATLAGILAIAGLRLAIVDAHGEPVATVPRDVVRDNAGRRLPAHLDARPLSDHPISAMLDTHYDRPRPRAWYHHRPRRDRRRRRYSLGPMDDHPTGTSLAASDRERRDARRARAFRRASESSDPACGCPVECWVSPRCIDDCTCRCEP
ncbi:helix-turn-helix domain-containing protein [Agromyces larvae]|uniref:Helix-turn-helix domain-containing protein n=1 Tax=Agromyces larvae TaxID=2929802 RepID=A0ABY4BXV1_9MICO|nr:helix-turn-helix transcriptional regulator [Agromyces larvae]UOE42506.1 helix-turn-helix domain-containing protein [Agromyces larvae]